MGHTDPGSRAPERRALSGRQRFFQLFYLWSCDCFHRCPSTRHKRLGVWNIIFAVFTCYPSFNLTATIIDRGRCDKTPLPLRLIQRLAGIFVFSWYSQSISIEERKMGIREWRRLKGIPQGSVENSVIRSYVRPLVLFHLWLHLDTLCSLSG